MDENVKAILDMIHHYWWVKGIIDADHLAKALRLFRDGNNPFLNKDILSNMNDLILKNYPKGYQLSHEVFSIKLENDGE